MNSTDLAPAWSTRLPDASFDEPAFTAHHVMVRVFNSIHAYAEGTGKLIWSAEIPNASVRPVTAAQGFTIVGWKPAHSTRDCNDDQQSIDDLRTRLIGFDASGHIRWRAELGTDASTAYVLHDQVWLIGVDSGKSFLHRVAPTTGHVTTIDLTWGATQLAAHRQGLLACSAFGDAARPGLYTLSAAGVFGQALRDEPVYRVYAAEDHIAIITDGDHEDGGRLAVLDPTTFAERWAIQTGALHLVLSNQDIAHVAVEDPRCVVLRNATTGVSRWQSLPLEREIVSIEIAAGYVFAWGKTNDVVLRLTDGHVVHHGRIPNAVAEHQQKAFLVDHELACWNPAANP